MMTDKRSLSPADALLHRMGIMLPPVSEHFPEGLKAFMFFSIAKARLGEMIQERIHISGPGIDLDFDADINA